MATLHALSGDPAFDPETTRAIAAALDDAWRSLMASHSVFATELLGASAREFLSDRIVKLATEGERDSYCLRDGALAAFGRPTDAGPARGARRARCSPSCAGDG